MRKSHLVFSAFLFLAGVAPAGAQVQHVRELLDTVSVAGSTEVIDQKSFKKRLANNALEVLNGQAAGVNVTVNGSDRMAMLNSVRVRGTTSIMGGNDPLVIIDGVTSSISALSSIFPADIESFTILKNASETALYGSRGASGVIEVKTKKGTGGGFQISYDGNYGFQSMFKSLEMLDGPAYAATARQLGVFFNDGGYNTDFFKSISRTGGMQNQHLAFSGGSDVSNYRASFSFMDQNTIIRNNDYQNLVVKLDVTQKAFEGKLTGNFGVFGSYNKNHDIFDAQKLFYSAAVQNPTFSYGPDAGGNYRVNSGASQINHPAMLLREKNDRKDMTFNTHLLLTYEFFRDLRLSAFGSYSYTSSEIGQFCPTWVWAQGNIYRGEFKTEDWLGNVSLNYQHRWGVHQLEAGISGEYQKQTNTGFWVHAKGITSNELGYHNIGVAASRPFGGTGSSYADPSLASVMGNVSYRLMDRYSLSLTTRADGSSMVGEDHKWGFFPSVSASWEIHKEEFMKRQRVVSMLKLRTGYGRSGNLGGITSYTTVDTYLPNGLVSAYGSPTVTMAALRNANPDLKWETRSTFNVGLDMGFWNNRLMLTAEYYYSKTTDMLYEYDVPVPPFAYDKLLANIGSMSNKGFEVGMSITPLQKKDMELNINLNMAYQQNKLLSLNGTYRGMEMSASDVTPMGYLYGAGQKGGDNAIIYQIVGQPLGVFYLPHCQGLVKDEKGHYHYDIADLDGNGKVDLSDGGDRYVAGQATPKVTVGSNFSFRYKWFDVSLQINGAFGHKIFNGTALSYNNMSSFPDYNVMKGAPERNIMDMNVSDYWLENGNYVNFEYLTIGYNVPVRSKLIRSLRISCNINNLGTITGYSGLTPMINSYVVNSTLGIDDKRTYPLYRTYSFGLSIQF